jgi:acyl-CoA synthetase (AMP-forming)/AMP-acid ligase II
MGSGHGATYHPPMAATVDVARSDLNLATAWEAVADEIPDRLALWCGDQHRTWAEFDDRAARLSAALVAAGVEPGAKVAIALFNGNEYTESEFAAFKARAVPCNVNYRYVADEIRYVLDNADAEVIVYDASLRDRIDAVRQSLPKLRLLIELGAGDDVPPWAVGYESSIATHAPAPRIARHGDDQWFLYTGGTTGSPKAVMWDHRGLFGTMGPTFRPLGHEVPVDAASVARIARDVTDRGAEVRQLAASPLMHGTAGVSTKATLTHGGLVATLTSRSLDPDEVWRCVQDARITLLTIVGDVFSRPLIDALDVASSAGRAYDLSSLRTIVSSGIMWSEQVKEAMLQRHDVMLVDILGSSEGTGMARQVASRKRKAATARFELGEHTRVFTDDGHEVVPGSGDIGKVALGFPIPLGYYKDPDKTEAAFPTIAGRRWSIPGDHATVEADGSIVLLGRGSACINTGGEKVYPEEVEEALKAHPTVVDANVVGVPDDKWGQAVVAVVSLAEGASVAADDLIAHTRTLLAAYKAPKRVVFVDRVERGANGKPDYRWAREVVGA